MIELIFRMGSIVIVFWIGFYYGYIHGEVFFRCLRYCRCKVIRWFQGRHKYNDKAILGR